MPITFSLNKKQGYFTSRFKDKITNTELVSAYKNFYQTKEWIPWLNELVDLSEVKESEVSTEGLKQLAAYIETLCIKQEICTMYTAVYAPKDLGFGMAKIYHVMTDEKPENVLVFRELREAELWLEQQFSSDLASKFSLSEERSTI